jgi:hypothetical protein
MAGEVWHSTYPAWREKVVMTHVLDSALLLCHSNQALNKFKENKKLQINLKIRMTYKRDMRKY